MDGECAGSAGVSGLSEGPENHAYFSVHQVPVQFRHFLLLIRTHFMRIRIPISKAQLATSELFLL